VHSTASAFIAVGCESGIYLAFYVSLIPGKLATPANVADLTLCSGWKYETVFTARWLHCCWVWNKTAL